MIIYIHYVLCSQDQIIYEFDVEGRLSIKLFQGKIKIDLNKKEHEKTKTS